jgi:hypothetical protein
VYLRAILAEIPGHARDGDLDLSTGYASATLLNTGFTSATLLNTGFASATLLNTGYASATL